MIERPSVVERAWKSCAICLEEMADKDLRKHTSCSCLLCQMCIEVLPLFDDLFFTSSSVALGNCYLISMTLQLRFRLLVGTMLEVTDTTSYALSAPLK